MIYILIHLYVPLATVFVRGILFSYPSVCPYVRPSVCPSIPLRSLRGYLKSTAYRQILVFPVLLQKNQSLEYINLGWNGFAFEGCVALSEALRHNTCLEKLNISCNRIHPPALLELMKGLCSNKVLKILVVRGSPSLSITGQPDDKRPSGHILMAKPKTTAQSWLV